MDLIAIDKKLQNEFAIKRVNAENVAYTNSANANKIPQFVEICKIERELIFKLGIEKAKENQDKKIIEDLSKNLDLALDTKNKLLSKLNLKVEDLTPKYSCEKCKDTGFILDEMCSCYKRKRNYEFVKQLGIDINEMSTFNDIDESLFRDKKQLEEFKKLKCILEKWCDNYPKVKKNNILLYGPTGIGKTFLTKCMAKKLIDNDFSVCFLTAFNMNDIFIRYHSTLSNVRNEMLKPIMDSEILFIDDLGSEPNFNNITSNYLCLILSEREKVGKSTIVSTNFSEEKIFDHYGERICSRLYNKLRTLCFDMAGQDLRLKLNL